MEKQFNPGKLRFNIEFLILPTSKNEYGELSGDWTVFKKAKANKEPILGNEFFSALTTDSKVEVKFNCRFFEGVENNMRIRHGNKLYEILSAIDVNSRHKELLCYCKLVK